MHGKCPPILGVGSVKIYIKIFVFLFSIHDRDCPSKKDADVLRAIGDVPLGEMKYPQIETWIRRVKRVSLKEREK